MSQKFNLLENNEFNPLPPESHGDYSSTVLSNFEESWFCHIKMLEWRIAPSTIVISLCKIWGAKVCSCDSDGAREAPPGVIIASHFVTSTTGQAIVEQGCAQSCSVSSISLAVQVPITTCSSCISQKTLSNTTLKEGRDVGSIASQNFCF